MMPAAVMVATVADPVARRTATATSHPARRAGTAACWIQAAMMLAIPESTRVCLNPPPAPTMSRIPAMGASEAPTRPLTSSAPSPRRAPKRYMAARTVISRATIGLPTNRAAWTTRL